MTQTLPQWHTRPPVTRLEEHQVFIFGSNKDGFHGAGSAGMAMRGDARNTWREDATFQAAMRAPAGDPARTGLWTVFGHAQGPSVGRAGKSFAVQTIVQPGARRSFPLDAGAVWRPGDGWTKMLPDIQSQLVRLAAFATSRPHLEFLVTRIGQGYSGYSREEIDALWAAVTRPANLVFIQTEASGPAGT